MCFLWGTDKPIELSWVLNKTGRWLMSRIVIVKLICHRHKSIDNLSQHLPRGNQENQERYKWIIAGFESKISTRDLLDNVRVCTSSAIKWAAFDNNTVLYLYSSSHFLQYMNMSSELMWYSTHPFETPVNLDFGSLCVVTFQEIYPSLRLHRLVNKSTQSCYP
jgi:hypothetical protein